MKERKKWNLPFVCFIFAIIIAIYTSAKVALKDSFWIDNKIAHLFANVPHSWHPLFKGITELGDKLGIGLVALLMLAWLLVRRKDFIGAAALSLSVAIGNELSKLLKDVLARPRPNLEHFVDVESYSYPSGHSMVGMIIYFFIAFLLIKEEKSQAGKVVTGVVFAILILLIGASRIILQVHYASDVIGGFALGYIWVYIWIILYNKMKK